MEEINIKIFRKKNIKNKIILFPLTKNKDTYFLLQSGNRLYSSYTKLKKDKEIYGDISGNDFSIYIFGKKSPKFNDIIQKKLEIMQNMLYLYSVSGSTKEDEIELVCSVQDLRKRDIDTLFFDNNIKESIINHVDLFFKNSKIYSDRDIRYKTGILLYGKPGTGKTSLSNAIATYYNRSMVKVDMPTFANMDVSELKSSIDYDDRKYVVLLEDIDCVFDSANRESDNATKDDKMLVNKLLQFLDGNDSPNDVIFIATTNHIEMLDEALIRDGRFDLKLEVPGIKESTAMKMCKSFNLSDDLCKLAIKECSKDNIINQSSLQNTIFKIIKDNEKEEI